MAVLERAHTVSSSATIAAPGNVAGDLIVILVGAAWSTPTIAGFTKITPESDYSSFYFLTLFYKISTGSEPANYTISAGAVEAAVAVSLYNVETSSPLDSAVFGVSTGSPVDTMTSRTTTVDGDMLLFGAFSFGSPAAAAGMTLIGNGGPGGTYSIESSLFKETISPAGATGSRTSAGSVLVVGVAIRASAVAPVSAPSIYPGLLLPV